MNTHGMNTPQAGAPVYNSKGLQDRIEQSIRESHDSGGGIDGFLDRTINSVNTPAGALAFAASLAAPGLGSALAEALDVPAIVGKGIVNTAIGGLRGGAQGAVLSAAGSGLGAINPDLVSAASSATGIPANVIAPVVSGVESGTLSTVAGGDFATGAATGALRTGGTGLLNQAMDIAGAGDTQQNDGSAANVVTTPYDPNQSGVGGDITGTPLEPDAGVVVNPYVAPPPVTGVHLADAGSDTMTDVTAGTTGDLNNNGSDIAAPPPGVTVSPYVDPGQVTGTPLDPVIPGRQPTTDTTATRPTVSINGGGGTSTPSAQPAPAPAPAADYSGHIGFDASGHMQLLHADGTPVFSTSELGKTVLAGVGYGRGLINNQLPG